MLLAKSVPERFHCQSAIGPVFGKYAALDTPNLLGQFQLRVASGHKTFMAFMFPDELLLRRTYQGFVLFRSLKIQSPNEDKGNRMLRGGSLARRSMATAADRSVHSTLFEFVLEMVFDHVEEVGAIVRATNAVRFVGIDHQAELLVRLD